MGWVRHATLAPAMLTTPGEDKPITTINVTSDPIWAITHARWPGEQTPGWPHEEHR